MAHPASFGRAVSAPCRAAGGPEVSIKADLAIGRRRWNLRLRVRAAASTKPDLAAAGQQELEKLGAPEGSKVTVRTTRAPRVS